ncbi:hypothetical protein EYC80_008194 [Monilinia laxa]|uniref:EKC/KEOPS complex subunit BUD32 n=1 Tax=Monilinia laxa TaxID=61186 RepID=A0A5N6JVQ2_MONLA|nr:hypothetical protein EYC80_008194 [Monilinia laxa]
MSDANIRLKHCESLYGEGGFHPIHLDDTFKHDRYKVIHKLGHGGFATVWLARDNKRKRYVALKVLASRLSRASSEVEILRVMRSSPERVGKSHVMSLLDHFFHQGPNGEHLCLVSEVGGPSIRRFNECPGLYKGSRRLEAFVARNVCLQAINGLDCIHNTGIVHGDFTPANILLQLANIDEWTVEQIYQRLGFPQRQEILRAATTLKVTESSFPDYAVVAIDMNDVDPKWISDEIIIIDFGISFLQKTPSLDIGTPKSYCAPEFLFGFPRSTASDIWALGCTIFEIRTGARLFKYKGTPKRDEMLIATVKLLGTLPDEWWGAWKEGLKWYETQTKMSQGSTGNILEEIMETGAHDGDSPPHKSKDKDNALKHVQNYKKLFSQGVLDTTGNLVVLVETLDTEEAEEVLRDANDWSPVKNDSDSHGSMEVPGSGSSNQKSSNAKNSEEKSSVDKSSDAKSSEQKSSEVKSSEKTPSSEGISTGATKAGVIGNPLASVLQENQSNSPVHLTGYASKVHHAIEDVVPATKSEPYFGPVNVHSFLEPSGFRIAASEAESLEDLLRNALKFRPEERSTASKLSQHIWLSDVPKEINRQTTQIIIAEN